MQTRLPAALLLALVAQPLGTPPLDAQRAVQTTATPAAPVKGATVEGITEYTPRPTGSRCCSSPTSPSRPSR
ncbi:MAG: hypothetical protein U5K74_01430 [Gemmatimonadaceae bacterium]|nr:hypothetical protein [Gemmatimonadaceae bacterium]